MTSVGLPVGTIVKHAKFGLGKVKNANTEGTVYNIFFNSINTIVLGVNATTLDLVEIPQVTSSSVLAPQRIINVPFPISPAAELDLPTPIAKEKGEKNEQDTDLSHTPPAPTAGDLIENLPGDSNVIQTISQSPKPVASGVIIRETDYTRLTLECLRQGLPPPGKLAHWTVGNLTATTMINDSISRALGGTGEVLSACANYGHGKTHFGRIGRELAQRQGLISMHAELDGSSISLAQGTRLVATLCASARLPEEAQDKEHLVPGLSTILKRAALKAKRGIPEQLSEFLPFLENTDLWTESDEVIQLLEGYLSGYIDKVSTERKFNELIGTRIRLNTLRMDSGRMEVRCERQAKQLGRIVQLAMMAGAKGAFIVLDEIDHDYIDILINRKNLLLVQLCELTRRLPIVLLLLAREPVIGGATELPLDEITDEDFNILINKTIDSFSAVHPNPCFAKGRKALSNKLLKCYEAKFSASGWGPRFFVRAAVECCEYARHYNLDSLAKVNV